MRNFLSAVVPLLALLGSAVSQHVDLVIPEVQRYVASMNERFAEYTDYHGPTATHNLPKPTAGPQVDCSTGYWLESIKHQGVAAFGASGYQVFRNVKDFGAKGDGVTDDTAAINRAISSGGRNGPSSGQSATNQPAIVYFPAGTYLISTSIIDYYYTQIIGNPNCMPTLKATAGFTGFGLIDGDQYQSSGNLGFGSTNVFYRQIRNLIFDMTAIPGSSAATGIHWPTAQATSLQNLVFKMSSAAGTQHQGIFCESGSGGWATDLTFNGGLYGLNIGNQQFTMRNLVFNNCVVGISQIWDWGFSYQGLTFNSCQVGLNMSSGGTSAQSVAGVVVYDSTFKNCPIGISTAWNQNAQPPASGSLVLENVSFQNTPKGVTGAGGSTQLAGSSGSTTVGAWAQGIRYTPNGPSKSAGSITANSRGNLATGSGAFYTASKPQYNTLGTGSFVSARSSGAKGDGTTDDTTALQNAINSAASAGKVLFVDAGTYKVTKTISVPAGSKIVGESYSVIMGSGSTFNNINSPAVVVQVGKSGQTGRVEWSDMIVATQGPAAGAILIEWNLQSGASSPSGMWDVHTRIGGFIGSNLQGDICPASTASVGTPKAACYGAYMSMHVTSGVTGLYLENNWFWTADHDIDNNHGGNQITIYTGRGLLIEAAGPVWLWGTGVEHHSLYQYQFYNTGSLYAGQIQTETPYWEPNPNAAKPFPVNSALHDPTYPTGTYAPDTSVPNADSYGLRVVGGSALIYGAGHYSFFDNYSTTCSNQGNGEVCQSRIVSIENNAKVSIYDLHVVGTRALVSYNGADKALYSDNNAGFSTETSLFRTS